MSGDSRGSVGCVGGRGRLTIAGTASCGAGMVLNRPPVGRGLGGTSSVLCYPPLSPLPPCILVVARLGATILRCGGRVPGPRVPGAYRGRFGISAGVVREGKQYNIIAC
jgi:hypothetical protein